MRGQDSCKSRRDEGNIRMSERDAVLVGPKAEKVGERDHRLDQHKSDLGDIEREEFQTERRRVI